MLCAVLVSVAPSVAAAQGGVRTVAVRGRVEGADVVRVARRYLGVRYELGGTTPAAFDCSGFVRYVFAELGAAMPRTAHEQAAVGDAPFPGDLQPGDLLFFYGGRGAQHIAIYVGNDTIVHASSRSRRVRLDRLGGVGAHRNWFGERLIAVRRVAPFEGVFRLPAGAPPPTDVAARGVGGGVMVEERIGAAAAAAPVATTSIVVATPRS
ncbi:MAG: C40 family peptidase [Gemmatimonadaceae bacterium]